MYRWKTFTDYTSEGSRTPYQCEVWDLIESKSGGRLLERLRALKGPRKVSYAEAGRMKESMNLR